MSEALTTRRLRLRRWTDGDRAPSAALNADPLVAEQLSGPLTPAESDAFVDRIEATFAARSLGLWAVELVAGGEFIGYAGLWPAEFEAPFTPAIEVGWRLAPAHWGHGYATEAARAAVADGFDRIGLREIVSFTAATNVRSIRVMEKLAMSRDPDEDFDHPRLPADHPRRRHVLYRLALAR